METIPEFEYDPAKSQANLEKHGIDFETAQALLLDSRKAVGPTVSPDEVRWMLVAMLDGKLWSAVFTDRAGRIRLISVRRSRPKEAANYGRQTDQR